MCGGLSEKGVRGKKENEGARLQPTATTLENARVSRFLLCVVFRVLGG